MSKSKLDTVWTIPLHRLDAATARRTAMAQHQRIRELLERARVVAEAALDEAPMSLDAVASAIGDIHATFEVHLRFEEKILGEILADDLPLGPARVEHLKADHARQRATLVSLHEEARAAPQRPLLAAKLAFLASWLLDEMADEERSMLNGDVVRDDAVVVDQAAG
ncbi:MAG TPA: hemerythrin domain-containing protein [Polyangia bacterium]|jgi:hemerythrin|nr:hemerythrin domain-containing protein [Polyangia bacterium]